MAEELEHEPVGAWQGEQPLPPGTRSTWSPALYYIITEKISVGNFLVLVFRLLEDDLPEWQEMNYMLRISQPPQTCR